MIWKLYCEDHYEQKTTTIFGGGVFLFARGSFVSITRVILFFGLGA